MSLEELFVKKYEETEEKLIELEKKVKLLEIEVNQKQQLLDLAVEFLKNGEPRITSGEQLYLSYFLYGNEKDTAIELFKKLGINIKEKEQ